MRSSGPTSAGYGLTLSGRTAGKKKKKPGHSTSCRRTTATNGGVVGAVQRVKPLRLRRKGRGKKQVRRCRLFALAKCNRERKERERGGQAIHRKKEIILSISTCSPPRPN